jgi:hypothetical protein
VTAILLGGAIAFWIAVGVTLNFTIARQAPAFVESWWPTGVTAKVTQGQSQLTGMKKLSTAEVDRLRASLRSAALREPVNTDALSTLAVFEEYRTGPKLARRLFRASEAVSRRNTLTQLWLIEDAISQGKIAETIRHYNRAMLVSNDARTILIPVLGAASSDADVLKALLPSLARRPLWWKDYMLQLGKSGDSAATMAAALRATRLDVSNLDEAALAQLILRRMVDIKEGHAAVLAANRLEGVPGATRSLRDGGFEKPSNVIPFSWWLRDEASIRAYRDAVPNGSTGLHVFVSSGAGGGVAQQLIGLGSGRYVLRGQAGNVSFDRAARPTINIDCETGKSLTHAELPPSDGEGRGFRFAFEIPTSNCPLQWVTIVTAPAVDTDIWLDNLAITH